MSIWAAFAKMLEIEDNIRGISSANMQVFADDGEFVVPEGVNAVAITACAGYVRWHGRNHGRGYYDSLYT